ncbi:MAG: cytochrome [Pseudonocardia sp. SCN 72-86]|nr:MAG: cytochrome [Pseudonocardia sp. SCN 72-86]
MSTSTDDVRPEWVVDFDVYDPALTTPVDRMTEEKVRLAGIAPVLWSTAHGGHWLVSSYELVHHVLRHPEDFSSFPNSIVGVGQGKLMPLELDPPEHTAYRRALQPLFSPTRMRVLETEIRKIVIELIDAFPEDGHVEFVSAFSHELPAHVFLALMGWPLEDAPMFTEMTDIARNGRPGDSPEQVVKSRAEGAGVLFGYFGRVVADRRQRIASGTPDVDVTTAIVQAAITDPEQGERPMTDDELIRMFFLLLIAGLHTVQGSLSWMMIHLSRNPDQRARIVADPRLIPAAVEEVLRFEVPTAIGRRARRDVRLGDVDVRAGDQLLLLAAAANRDAAQFDRPGEFHVDRELNRHLTFGAGPHRCVGSHLARIELRVAMEELHARVPNYRVDPGHPAVVAPSQVRSVHALPLIFER